jgi:hypothetical protein
VRLQITAAAKHRNKGVSVQCHYLKDKSVIKQIDRMEKRIKREVLNT